MRSPLCPTATQTNGFIVNFCKIKLQFIPDLSTAGIQTQKFYFFLSYNSPVNANPLNTTTALGIGFGAFIIYSLFRKGSALQTLNFYPGSIRSLTFNNGKPYLTFEVKAQNTSNQSFTIQSMAGNVYANDTLIGNVKMFDRINISPNSEGTITLKAEMMLLGLLQDIISAIETGTIKQDIEIDMYANIDNLQIPVDLNYSIG